MELADMTIGDGQDVLLHATMREIQEETGFSTGLPVLLSEHSTRNSTDLVIRQLYSYETGSQDVILSDEHMEYKWVEKNELVKIDFKTPSLERLLKEI